MSTANIMSVSYKCLQYCSVDKLSFSYVILTKEIFHCRPVSLLPKDKDGLIIYLLHTLLTPGCDKIGLKNFAIVLLIF